MNFFLVSNLLISFAFYPFIGFSVHSTQLGYNDSKYFLSFESEANLTKTCLLNDILQIL